MSASNLTTVRFIYKRDYSTKKIADLTMRDHVWWAKVHKEGGFEGKSFTYPIPYAAPQGVSGTFSKARTNASSTQGVDPEAYRTAKFGIITLDGEAVLASQNNKKAFYNLVTRETDSILMEMGDSYAFDYYRDTYGIRGKISAINGNILTLTEPSHARNFKKGMTLGADDTATGASPRTGTGVVASVSLAAGTVTLVNVATITSLSVNDFLFRDGDPGTCMEGMEVCTPLAAPVAGVDSFRGIDRGVMPELLAGSRLDDSSLNAEVALARGMVLVSMNGRSHNIDEGYLHPTHFFNAAQRLNAKVEYSDGGGTANYGFQHMTIHTAAGSMKVYSDPDCPLDRGRGSRSGSQYIKHLGELPHIIDLDGNMTLRQTDENGIETRAQGFCNLIQDDPAAQFVCSLATS